MIRLGICDADADFRKQLRWLCEEYLKKQKREFEILEYGSGEELLHAGEPDLLILDIDLGRIDGILIKEIYEKRHARTKFLFLTSKKERMQEAFGRNVYGFLIKPFGTRTFYSKFGQMLGDGEGQEFTVFPPGGRTSYQLIFRDIIYIQSAGRQSLVHLGKREGSIEIQKLRMNLKDWERLLSKREFVRVNRRQIVNLRKVVDINREMELIDQTKLWIGESYRKSVWESYDEFRNTRPMVRGEDEGADCLTGKMH